MILEVEIAWAAGLFEGEGCISIFQQKNRAKHRNRWHYLNRKASLA